MADKCEKCKHKIRRGWEYPCSICGDISNGEETMFEPKTNADRIRSMTDEELAELLEDVRTHGFTSLCCNDSLCDSDGCDCCVMEWLKSECEV